MHPKADRRYTWWPSRAAIERFRLDGRLEVLRHLYPHLKAEYSRWIAWSKSAQHDCLWQACHDDGEENSIGLDGCRPSINAAMAGEAAALATMASLLGEERSTIEEYRSDETRWRRALHSLWDETLQFFVTRTYPPPESRQEAIRKRRTKVGKLYSPPGPCPPKWKNGERVNVRELMGLSWPFYHQQASPEHAVAWRQIKLEDGFAAKWGLRTAERRHTCYNFTTWCQTSWNGPVWPFESAKTATALINSLHDSTMRIALKEQAQVGPSDFFRLLNTYAMMHTKGTARAHPQGEPFIGESFHPDDGYWYTRELMFQRKMGDKKRGDHYLHSSYIDLVLSGLVGLHVVLNDSAKARLVVEPLFVSGEQLTWFAASNVRVRGHDVDVAFDADGTRYGKTGLAVWIDEELAAHSAELRRLEVGI